MKRLVKKWIRKLPGGDALLEPILRYRFRQFQRRFKDQRELFTDYYQNNRWQNEESRSGSGSTLEYTENIRKEIPLLIKSLGIKSILDAPCGDYNWFRLIQRDADVSYIGGDIVEPLVADNNKKFGNANTCFVVLDITSDSLPATDLWLCRDCLFHLPNSDIQRALTRFRESSIRYLLTSDYPGCRENIDIAAGGFRPIDLRLPPFNLCPPQLLIDDWIPGAPVRSLALWERSALI